MIMRIDNGNLKPKKDEKPAEHSDKDLEMINIYCMYMMRAEESLLLLF